MDAQGTSKERTVSVADEPLKTGDVDTDGSGII